MSELVSVFRGARGEAIAIAGMLRANGIDASLSSDDVGGLRPDVGFVQGTRVLVDASDVDDARRLIEDAQQVPS